MNEVVQLLAKENFKLAGEVDLLSADLKYLQDVMVVMSRLLAEHNVPVPSEQLALLAMQHAERIHNISVMADAVDKVQSLLLGMRTGKESAGMRTGGVTAEDITRVLSDIDPEIVRKMGE